MAVQALLPVGTALATGDPTPPSTTAKANAAFLWGLVPVLLGAVVEVLTQATTLFAGAPTWVLTTCAVVLVILGPVAAYVGTQRTANRLLQPVLTVAEPAPPV